MGSRTHTLTLAAVLLVLGASSYLTFFIVHEQLSDSPAVKAAMINAIKGELSEYGLAHGGWSGSEDTVRRLSQVTGERIKLTSTSSKVLVDTDLLAGNHQRPVGKPVARIDPRPHLILGPEVGSAAAAVTMLEIRQFRRDAALAGCLTKAGIPVDVMPGPHGVPRLVSSPSPQSTVVDVTTWCPADDSTSASFLADKTAILGCGQPNDSAATAWTACLSTVFTDRTTAVTAEPAVLFVGTLHAGAPVTFTPPLVFSVAVQVLALMAAAVQLRRPWRRRSAARAATSAELGTECDHPESKVAFADLTEEMERQHERQRQMVAYAAHELRAPLTTMRAYLEGLTDGVLDPEPELFASINDEALLQQRIIDDLQQQSALDEVSLTFRRVQLDVAALVQAWAATHLAATESPELRTSVSAEGPLPITGDPDRLRQVLGNLLSNAVRYTPVGGSVEVRTWRDGAYACVQVRDSGIGISAEELPKIFERNWRSDAARERVPVGTGVGLHVTREIVVAHNGTISVDSRLGVGTAVTMLLPISTAQWGAFIPSTQDTGYVRHRHHRASR